MRKSNAMYSQRSCQLMTAAAAIAFAFSAGHRAIANHPFHISTAEVEFNAHTKRLEIGLKCQSLDLERALRGMAGRKIDIEKDQQFDELVTRYLSDNFYLAVAATETKDKTSSTEIVNKIPATPKEAIKLVGKEFETTWVWIYFELQPPLGDDPLVLVNRVLFEVNAGQINTCLIRQNGQRHALKSTTRNPLQTFKREWLAASLEKVTSEKKR